MYRKSGSRVRRGSRRSKKDRQLRNNGRKFSTFYFFPRNPIGNYENNVLLDAACSATPSTVRTALRHPALQCRETPLPALSAAFASKYCLISNWASGSVSLELPDCIESFHQPVFNVSSLRHSLLFDVAMVFRAAGRPGRLGVLWLTRTPGAEHELRAGLPLEL